MGSRFVIALLTIGCASTVLAAELLKPAELKDFKKSSALTSDSGVLVAKGPVSLFSEKTVPVDPSKKYKISGKFRAKAGTTPSPVYFGYAPLDAAGAAISSEMVSPIPNTDTELAEPVKAGDTVLKVKDASKWNKQTKYGVIAFNTRPDLSDLPNGDVVGFHSEKIQNKDGVWEVPLKTPAKKAYAKGTRVRQQTYAATYIYNGAVACKTSGDWQTFSGVISGHSKSGTGQNNWWVGTKSARIIVIPNFGSKDGVTEFSDIVLETID